MCQVKFNIFLHLNEHAQRIFWYIVRRFEAGSSKIGHIFTKYSILKLQEMIKCHDQKLFCYSYIEKRKSFSERFSRVLTLKMDFENQKNVNICCIKPFYMVSKNPLSMFIGMLKAIEFTMKFHNRHHATVNLSNNRNGISSTTTTKAHIALSQHKQSSQRALSNRV